MARVLLVVGSERSGTSTVVGILRELGWHVPQPELAPNDMNPRGFGEPEWAVRFNSMTLDWANVHISDARPRAWSLIDERTTSAERRQALTTWLSRAVGAGRDLVIKDPRLTWLYRSWRQAVVDVGAEPSTLVVGRAPAETLASKLKVNPARREAGGLAGWVNVCLRAEYITRGDRRAFVTYGEVVTDWETQLRRVVSQWGEPRGPDVSQDARDQIASFIDPSLHRNHGELADFDVPIPLAELAQELWGLYESSARGGVVPGEAFESLRRRYDALYDGSEALVESSLGALQRSTYRRLRRLEEELEAARADVVET
jgi:hypothetical protein